MMPIGAYQFLIPLLLVLLHLLLAWRLRTRLNPASMAALWWGFWLWIATFSFTGIFPPTEEMIWITLTMVGGIALGALCAPRPPTTPIPITSPRFAGDRFYANFTRAYPWLLGTALVMIVPVFLRGLVGLAFFESGYYKSEAFGTPERAGWLFRSNTLESLYFIFSGPLLLGILLVGLAVFFMTGRTRKLAVGMVLSFMDAILRMGRINIYLVCLLVVIGAFLMWGVREGNRALIENLKRKAQIGAAVLVFLGLFVLWIGVARKDSIAESSANPFEVYVIDYHTVGFSLFGSELKTPGSAVRTTPTYGRLTFGGLDSLVTIVIRRFNRDYNCPALTNMVRMAESRVAGHKVVECDYLPKYYNSYYTNLYTLYSDGRYLGLLLGGFGLGYLMTFFYTRWRKRGDIESLVWVLFLLNVSILGIFVSTLENMRTWLVVLGLLALRLLPAPRKGAEIG